MEPVFISVGVMVGALLLVAYYVQNGIGGMSQPLQTLGRFLLIKAPAGAVDLFDDSAGRGGRTWARIASLIATAKIRSHSLEDIEFKPNGLYLVAEDIEKPGNLGAMLRTADAAGVDAVIVCDPQTDVYNPNTIRASLGAVFSLPVVAVSNEEALNWLRQNDITVMTTSLEASKSLYDCDLKMGCALVLGSESAGVTDFWLQNADQRIIIPMAGQVDSLNLSASAAVVLFEVVRQRASDKG